MPDREKVIKGLEHCTRPLEVGKGGNFCMDCPYTEAIGFNQFKCNSQQMMRDALSLLKEQREKIEAAKRWLSASGVDLDAIFDKKPIKAWRRDNERRKS